MITDEIMMLLDEFAALFTNREQRAGVEAVRALLGDYEAGICGRDNLKEWLSSYLPQEQ